MCVPVVLYARAHTHTHAHLHDIRVFFRFGCAYFYDRPGLYFLIFFFPDFMAAGGHSPY